MEIIINDKTKDMTVKEFLFGQMGFSTGMVKKLKFTENGITVNGEFKTVRYVLNEGDVLRLKTEDTPEDTCPYMIPVDLNIKIAYEDEYLTVVDKPPMMPAHPSYFHRLDTVANALAFRYSSTPFVFRPVNRLDRDTSGLMLTARTRPCASRLYRSMINGDISKLYIALLSKAPEKQSGIIKTYMKRADESIIMRRVCDGGEEKAKIAITAYKVLFTGDGVCAVAAAPITGRTHQLRVHFFHIGCPLLGDTMYGGTTEKIDRHALHSAYLSFPHPNGQKMEIYSLLPHDMKAVLGDDADTVWNGFLSVAREQTEALKKKFAQFKEEI